MKTRKEKFKELFKFITINVICEPVLFVILFPMYIVCALITIVGYPFYYYILNYNNSLYYLLDNHILLQCIIDLICNLLISIFKNFKG